MEVFSLFFSCKSDSFEWSRPCIANLTHQPYVSQARHLTEFQFLSDEMGIIAIVQIRENNVFLHLSICRHIYSHICKMEMCIHMDTYMHNAHMPYTSTYSCTHTCHFTSSWHLAWLPLDGCYFFHPCDMTSLQRKELVCVVQHELDKGSSGLRSCVGGRGECRCLWLKHGPVFQSTAAGVKQSWHQSSLCLLLAAWPWTCYLPC
jgi:hypothetical protein